MKNMISHAMNSVASFLKQFRLERLLVVVLAGFLLLVNTACSSDNSRIARNSDAGRSADARNASTSPYKGQGQNQRELYDTIQPRKGGMNEYSDDLKQEQESTNARAEDLINRSKQNLQKRVDSPGQYAKNYREGTPLGERVRNITEDVAQPGKELKENLSEGAEKGTRNIKENAAQFSKDAPNVVKQAGRNAQEATEGFREGARDLTKGAQRAVDRAVDAVQNGA